MSSVARRALCLVVLACVVPLAGAATPSPDYRVLTRLPLGGEGGWDYLAFDGLSRHLFVTRGDRVEVVDVDHAKRVATISGTQGVHGIAINPKLRRGYASNGATASVTVFDLDSLKTLATIHGTGEKPDAIAYDPASTHVFTFNGKGHSFSVIDTQRNVVLDTVALPGKPEFAVSDGEGSIYVNLEDTAKLARIDVRSGQVAAIWSLGTCESPSGLAIDARRHRLFSVCDNRQMAITDASNGNAVASVPIGEGPDAVVFDEGASMVFSSNGESGNITAVHEEDADHYSVVATIPTQASARTLTLDPKLHRLYLSAAQLSTAKEAGGRPTMVPGSFTVLTVGEP